MNTKKLSDTDERLLWQEAGRRILMAAQKPAVPKNLVDRLREQLPEKKENETFAELIRRASAESKASQQQNKVVRLSDKTTRQYTPLSEFDRLAADSSGSGISLPDPNCELESADGRFRLNIMLVDDNIQITIQALGFASDEFANRSIAIANPLDHANPIGIIELDEDGDGVCTVDDNDDNRRALLHPVLLLINET